MRWWVFAIFAAVAYVLEIGLRSLFELPIAGGVAPSFLWILAAFVALWAPELKAAWAAMILGLLLDLQPRVLGAGWADVAAVPGPAAVGFLLGAWAVLLIRGVFYRDSPLALGVCVLVGGLISQLVIVTLLTARGFPWPLGQPVPGWSAPQELFRRFFVSLYSAALSLPVGWVLQRYIRAWHFAPIKGGGFRRGR